MVLVVLFHVFNLKARNLALFYYFSKKMDNIAFLSQMWEGELSCNNRTQNSQYPQRAVAYIINNERSHMIGNNYAYATM